MSDTQPRQVCTPLFMHELAFNQLTFRLGWHGTVVKDPKAPYLVRPADIPSDMPLHEFFDLLGGANYYPNTEYLVYAHAEDGQTALSFAQWLGGNPLEASFMGLCFFPENHLVRFAITKDSISRLPDHLWSNNQQLTYLKNKTGIVYRHRNGILSTTTYVKGDYLYSDYQTTLSAFIPCGVLLNWLNSKEGRDFQRRELEALQTEKAPLCIAFRKEGIRGFDFMQRSIQLL